MVIDPGMLMSDFHALEKNGISLENRLFISARAHLQTSLHHEIKHIMMEARDDDIWFRNEDITYAFKPLKMGLRMGHMISNRHGKSFKDFTLTYDRILETANKVFRCELTHEQRANDLLKIEELYEYFAKHDGMVTDTVKMLNSEI